MIKSNQESAAAEAAAIREGAAAAGSSSGDVTGLYVTNTPSSANCTSAYDTVMGQAASAQDYVNERSDLAVKIDAVFQDVDVQMAECEAES